MTSKNLALLQVENLGVSFQQAGNAFQAVKGISFELKKGETLALAGESGSGKSVTALSISRLLPYPLAFHPSGSIHFEGRDLLKLSEKELCRVRGHKIGMIFQEPMTSLNPLHTIEKQISEVLMLHKGLTVTESRACALELLERVGIHNAEKRLKSFPHELSGGQRQRVMIAIALAGDPDLLIADEPTTALDVTTQAQILSLLKKLQYDMGMALLLITHDLNVVRKMADRVAIMRYGQIVEQGSVEQIFSNPQNAYTQELIHSESHGQAVPFDSQNPVVIAAKNLDVIFPIFKGFLKRRVDGLHAVQNTDLSIRAGETVGIVGESGSGKTTLAMALLRLQRSTGSIYFLGQDITNLKGRDLRALRQQMQLIFQDPIGSLSPRMTVAQIIAEGAQIHKLACNPAELEQMVVSIMQQVGLDPETRERYPHEFSGGQRQRIAIARALILKPKFMILDEPTSALDRAIQREILDLLKKLQTEYKMAYLFISHDLKVIQSICHRVLVMHHGQIVENGDTNQIFKNPQHPYTQKLIAAALHTIDLEEKA